MRPGCFPFCSGCRHRDVEMHRQGHPSPCGRQRWIGPQLHKPEITAAGCNAFEAVELPELPEPAAAGPSEGAG